MSQSVLLPSLHPYLEPNQPGFFIDLTGETGSGNAERGRSRFPFPVLNDRSTLTRLLRADVVSDGGSGVQPVFLLVQRDNYQVQTGELRPLTNPDIEAAWQRAHLLLSESNGRQGGTDSFSRSIIRLGRTEMQDGQRHAFQSLFFCSHRRLFFHPPCPRCGRPLALCQEEPLLAAQGLQAYATSLHRYLHCPSCPSSMEGNGFFRLIPDPTDPPGVQDCSGLIVAWRRLALGNGAPAGFPCSACPEKDLCHGPDNLSAIRITPFSFYPFHLLVFKAMTLRAVDFLALVSGAGVDEVEARLQSDNMPARILNFVELKRRLSGGDFFLFEGSGKHFLEVLYLKLSFLDEIAACMRTVHAPLDTQAALDCLWVEIPDQNRLLPASWGFSAGYMDIGLTDRVSAALSVTHPNQTPHFLGVLCYLTLLANRRQSAADIIASLAESHGTPSPTVAGVPGTRSAVFAPQNIFWSPEAYASMHLPPPWLAFWEKTLALGSSLLTTVQPEPGGWQPDQFQRDLTEIRSEIKRALFIAAAAPASEATAATAPDAAHSSREEAVAAENRAIHDILLKMIQKKETFKSAPPPVPTGAAEPQIETVIIHRAVPEGIPREMVVTAVNLAKKETAETVLLHRDMPIDSEPCETVMLAGTPSDEGLAETVILSPKSVEKTAVDNNRPPPDELPETVILTPGKPAPAPPPSAEVKGSGEDVGDDILSETVILRTPMKG